MTYICTGCSEKIEIDKGDSVMCPYCTCPLIDESKYEKVKEVMKNKDYTPKDLDDILEKEEELLKKVSGSALEKVKEYIEAMYKLLKDPKAQWQHKVIAIGALCYLIAPIDIIPDVIPVIGYVDDVAAVMIAVTALGSAIEKYRKNEIINKKDKKLGVKLNIKNIFNNNEDVDMKNTRAESIQTQNEYEKVDLSESMKNTDFIDKLVWYFSDNSIINDTIFNERFEQGLMKANIKKELELNSILDAKSRANIKKHLGADFNVKVAQCSKIEWSIDVEYYSLSDIERDKLRDIHENLKLKIDKRREKLISL